MIEILKNTATVLYAVGLMLFWLAVPIAAITLVMLLFPLLQVIWLAALGGVVLWGLWKWARRGFKSHPAAVAEIERLNRNTRALLEEWDLPDTWENRCKVQYLREMHSRPIWPPVEREEKQ